MFHLSVSGGDDQEELRLLLPDEQEEDAEVLQPGAGNRIKCHEMFHGEIASASASPP